MLQVIHQFFAAEFGTGQVLWSLLWLSLFVLWIWLLVTIFADLIRNRDLSGWGKALWAIAIIVLPIVGVLLYLIVNGDDMNQRAADDARASDQATQAYVRQTAGTPETTSEQLSTLADLHAAGTLSDTEYAQAKAKVIAG